MRNDVACFGNMTACRGHGSFVLSLAAVAPPSVVHSIIYLLLRVALEERCQRPMQNTVSWAECAPQAPKSSENSRFSTGNRHFS